MRVTSAADALPPFGTLGRLDYDELTDALLCHVCGLHDPNGFGYDGTGYTGTLLHHLPHYTDPRKAKVGALVVFGPGSGDHVCMVRHVGSDPVLFSHGSERGPIYIHLTAEQRYQRKPTTFLSIARL